MAPILGILASSQQGGISYNSYESISTVTLSSNASSISFSSIPSTYKHLQIRGISAGDYNTGVRIRFNGDTGSNYAYHLMQAGAGYGSLVYATGAATQTAGVIFDQQLGNSTNFNTSITDILDYTNTNKSKTSRTLSGVKGGPGGFMYLASSLWMNTSAITSISIFPNTSIFYSNTTFALYGIKG